MGIMRGFHLESQFEINSQNECRHMFDFNTAHVTNAGRDRFLFCTAQIVSLWSERPGDPCILFKRERDPG